MPGFKINNQGDGPSSTVEAARLHRWQVSFTGASISEDTMLYAKTIGRPVIEIDQIKMHYQQTEIYLPGKHRWSTITVDFYEILDEGGINKTTSEIFNYWADSVLDLAANTIANLDTIKQTRMTITPLDGQGGGATRIIMDGVWPIKVEPAELNYTTTDLSTTKVTFRFDAAEEVSS
ncbi:MAG: hypothetical protein V3T31_12255 [candidate division Zixibacteria bacterium]